MSLLSTTLFAAALLLSSRAEAAPLVIIKSTYSLTYADGWSGLGAPTGDTLYVVMNTAVGGAFAYGEGLALGNGLDAATFSQYLTAAYTMQNARIDSTNKVLGGNTFIISGFRDTSADADTTSRIRTYITNKGNYVFVSWISYKSSDEAAVMAQEEAALATLKITNTAGIRVATVSLAPALLRSQFDIQGRSRKPVGFRMPTFAIFRKQ